MKKFIALLLIFALAAQIGVVSVFADGFGVTSITVNTNTSGKVSNVDSANPFIEIVFSADVDPETVSDDTVIIKNLTTEVNAEYDIYSVSDNKVKIYLGELKGAENDKVADTVNYSITVTDGVKALADGAGATEYTETFSAGVIFNVPYVEGKVITNIAKDKRSYRADGLWQNDSTGTYNLYWLTETGTPNVKVPSLVENGGTYSAVIDLGGYYDVVGVGPRWYPAGGDSATPNDIAYSGSILAPWVSGADTVLLVASKHLTSNLKESAGVLFPLTNDDGKSHKVRYIKAEKSAGCYYRRLQVFAYVDMFVSDCKIIKDGISKSNIDENGTYSVEMKLEAYSPIEASRTILMAAYDENGSIISGKSKFAAVSLGAYGSSDATSTTAWTVEVDDDVKYIKCVCLEDISSGKLAAAPYVFAKSGAVSTAADTTKKLDYSYDSTSFAYTGSNSEYDDTSFLMMLALNDGVDFESATVSDIAYFDATDGTVVKSGDESTKAFKFVYKNETPGKYRVRFSSQPQSGSVDSTLNLLRVLKEDEITGVIDAFKGVESTEDLNDKIEYYTETDPLISLDMISELEDGVDDVTGKYYALLLGTQAYGNMGETADLIRLLQMSYVMGVLETQNAEKAYASSSKYDAAVKDDVIAKKCLESKDAVEKFQYVYSQLIDEIEDTDDFVNVVKWSEMLSYFANASAQTIADTIEAYDDLVDPDGELKEYIDGKESIDTGKDVTLVEIAKKFDTENLAQYYGTDNFAKKFKKYADALTKGKKKESSTVSSKRTGSSGGSSSYVAIGSDIIAAADANNSGTTATGEQTGGNATAFSDLQQYAWAQNEIAELEKLGIVSGSGNGSFEPSRSVTREEFVKMCVCAMNLNLTSLTKPSFNDYSGEEWFVPYIQIAVCNGVTGGTGDGTFGVGESITRQDAAAMISRAMQAGGYRFTRKAELAFGDTDDIAAYAKDDIAKINFLNIVKGYENGTFAPRNQITRAEAAVMIYRAYTVANGGEVK